MKNTNLPDSKKEIDILLKTQLSLVFQATAKDAFAMRLDYYKDDFKAAADGVSTPLLRLGTSLPHWSGSRELMLNLVYHIPHIFSIPESFKFVGHKTGKHFLFIPAQFSGQHDHFPVLLIFVGIIQHF